MKRKAIIMMISLFAAAAICGCGSSNVAGETETAVEAETDSSDHTEQLFDKETDDNETESGKGLNDSDGKESESEVKGSDADESVSEETAGNADEAGKSEPAGLYLLTKDLYIEDVIDKYTVNQQDQGFTGDIGDVIADYKNVDLDGDGTADIIKRYRDPSGGYGYSIDFSSGGNIDTGAFSASPNEGEVIEFYDMDKDNIDEILITHYTISTAGPMAWQTSMYARDSLGSWSGFPIIDEDNNLYCQRFADFIEERAGISFYDQPQRLAGIEMTEDGIAILIDFGMKDGPSQTLDYEAVLLKPDFDKINGGIATKRDAFEFEGASESYIKAYWPKET